MLSLLVGCSTTKSIPENDQLYTGLTKIVYNTSDRGAHLTLTKEEVSAALATAPNGALFGSSSVTSLIMAGATVIGYVIGEGLADSGNQKSEEGE